MQCPGCFQITTVFSHADSAVQCGSCQTLLCQPQGGKARLTEGASLLLLAISLRSLLTCHSSLQTRLLVPKEVDLLDLTPLIAQLLYILRRPSSHLHQTTLPPFFLPTPIFFLSSNDLFYDTEERNPKEKLEPPSLLSLLTYPFRFLTSLTINSPTPFHFRFAFTVFA